VGESEHTRTMRRSIILVCSAVATNSLGHRCSPSIQRSNRPSCYRRLLTP
jgi:hypothetical protein